MINKKQIPLIFLVSISLFWSFYYQSSNWLNDNGAEKPEWLLLIDGLIVLPILCFLCIGDRKESLIKALAYSCLIILLGSLIIPESSKLLWPYFESGRYLVLGAFLFLEVTTIVTVFCAVKASLNNSDDPDMAIVAPIEKLVGKGVLSAVLSFEARVWTYAIFSKRVKRDCFNGQSHFSYHQKDGTQSNLLGFILLIVFELPLMHLLLHFMWSPLASNVVSGLTLLGLVFFIAEYKAIAIRPISVSGDSLIIRYGIWNPLIISFEEIESVRTNDRFIRRASHIRRYNLSGNPNVEIKLKSGRFIYLGLDSPAQFIAKITESLK